MNITRFKRHISDVHFSNKSRNIEYSELAKFFFERKSKKVFKTLEKNGLDVDKFIREELMATTAGNHFNLMMNFIEKGILKPTDLKYVMSVDNFIDGMGDVYEKAQFLFANERPIYRHVNVDVDKMILKAIEKAKIFESQNEESNDLKTNLIVKKSSSKEVEIKNSSKEIVKNKTDSSSKSDEKVNTSVLNDEFTEM